jgi:SPX domain protein involved in polyphosphate accumulation
MKFGRQLEEAIYPEWQLYYISYSSLKADLRIASNNGVFTEKNETDFVEKLDKDLEKVKYKLSQTASYRASNLI